MRLMQRLLLCFLTVFAFALLTGAMPLDVFAVASEPEARAAVNEAQTRITLCYNAVADAESAGANVSELSNILNEAGTLLSRAQLALEQEKYDIALEFSSNCTQRLVGFTDAAEALRDTASQQRELDFVVNVIGSIVGTIAVVVGGWGAWVFLKRKYAETGSAV